MFPTITILPHWSSLSTYFSVVQWGCTCHPARRGWKHTRMILNYPSLWSLPKNPGTISQRNLEAAKLDPNYCQALHQSSIFDDNGILYYHEHIAGSESYARLQLIPADLNHIVFIALHFNTFEGHLKHTIHRIRLCFCWPKMHLYILWMCRSCPGCTLTNPTHAKLRELIYNLPNEAPFMVLYIDGYQARKESGFKGSSLYLIVCCGMCTFTVMEPVSTVNATTYAIMKIILHFGFCHTCVLDKDSKFFGYVMKSLTCFRLTAISLVGVITTPCWSNGSTVISMRACKSWQTSAILIALLWRPSSSLFMHGTHALYPARIYPNAWWPSGGSSPFQSNFSPKIMQNYILLLVLPNHIPRSLPLVSILPKYCQGPCLGATMLALGVDQFLPARSPHFLHWGYRIHAMRHPIQYQTWQSWKTYASIHWPLADCQVTPRRNLWSWLIRKFHVLGEEACLQSLTIPCIPYSVSASGWSRQLVRSALQDHW